jgi:PEP-CTERM motif
MKLFALALVSLLALAAPARADTIVTFGNVTPNQFFAVDNGDGTTTLSTTSSVNITQIILGATDPNALLTFTATSTEDAQLLIGGTVISQRFAGTFSLTNSAGTFDYLDGTFGAALEFGGTGSTGAILTANSSPQSPPLVLTTDLLLSLINPESFGLAFSNITPGLHVNTYSVGGVSHTTIANFAASYAGSADANLEAVPEPTSLVLLGSGLFGLAAKLRKRFVRA